MVKVAESTFSDVDVILWLVEPTTYIGCRGTAYPGAVKAQQAAGYPRDQQDRHRS